MAYVEWRDNTRHGDQSPLFLQPVVSKSYYQALGEVARRLGVLAHKGGQLLIGEWDLLAVLPTVLVVAMNHLTRGKA